MGFRGKLKVLFLAAEAAPFVKVGGLGDVAGALPQSLMTLGGGSDLDIPIDEESQVHNLDVRLVIPYHRAIRAQEFNIKYLMEFAIISLAGPIKAEVYWTKINHLPVYLISGLQISTSEQIYSRDPAEDGFKYTFFSLAALKLVEEINWYPDIIHANDWHTSPSVYALSSNCNREGFFKDTATLLGVHNLPYLGVGAGPSLGEFGLLPATGSDLPIWAQEVPLPLGLLTADHIVTVSPTYAQEILTPNFGAGLDDFLQGRQDSISGILNGIDIDHWDPEIDDYLSTRYQITTLSKKSENKVRLLVESGLPTEMDRPLLAMVTRLDSQKGVDLAFDALPSLIDQDWSIIILGTGDPSLEQRAYSLERAYPARFRFKNLFDVPLSHQVYAGADILLIPSRYEPCGLTQMIAMRYGTVPVGRATGGLLDTIIDYDQTSKGTGFIFDAAEPQSLEGAIRRAIRTYRDHRRWRGLQRRGMQQNFSWEESARKYRKLYFQLIKKKT